MGGVTSGETGFPWCSSPNPPRITRHNQTGGEACRIGSHEGTPQEAANRRETVAKRSGLSRLPMNCHGTLAVNSNGFHLKICVLTPHTKHLYYRKDSSHLDFPNRAFLFLVRFRVVSFWFRWFHFGFRVVSFWFHFGFILVSWFHFGFILVSVVSFWFHFGFILVSWFHFGFILVSRGFMVFHFGFILVSFWFRWFQLWSNALFLFFSSTSWDIQIPKHQSLVL